MELILLTNLAFSVVGFVFIFRMWREVKERRDYYGENFGIPRGEGWQDEQPVVQYQQPQVQQVQSEPVKLDEQMSMEQLTAMVVKAMEQQQLQQQQQVQPAVADGDLQRIIAAVAAQSGGGR